MRVNEVQRKIKEEGLSAFFFSSYPSVFYLTGFRSTHAFVVLTPEERHLFTDARYYERARKLLNGWELHLLKDGAFKAVKRFLKERGFTEVGYELERLSCSDRKKLKAKGLRWRGYEGFLTPFRARKTERELSVLREGAKKLEEAFTEVINGLGEGVTELALRGRLAEAFTRRGALGESFASIVAFREHSAVPHWESSETVIKGKGPLLVDTGLIWHGYCTDLTRTLHLGKPDEEFRKVYEAVKEAHLRAVEKVRPGVAVAEVDRTAREVLRRYGLEKFFTHATGHGIGIEVHEFPRVSSRSKAVLEEGFVVTVEPGVYLEGRFGVRLENMVAVGPDGPEVLYELPLELTVL
ncbi:MAG: aminopeptidase P family protein [Aquificae bacterium]|nr:aminopeptidase P family protein [Aquificota bacterium]